MRTRGWLIFFILSALGALLFALACGRKRTTEHKALAPVIALPDAVRTLTPLPVRPLSPKLARVRDQAMQAAASTRELSWQTMPGMSELTGWEYGTRTKEMADILGSEELRGLSRLAAAGGML